jgi:Zn-dependent peptidase ImmA (M78 family)
MSKIKVATQRYEVRFANPSACDIGAVNGWCDKDRKQIWIGPSLDAHLTRDVLWHEIFHALFHEHAFPEKSNEEKLVTFLGRAVEGFIQDNREFVLKRLV